MKGAAVAGRGAEQPTRSVHRLYAGHDALHVASRGRGSPVVSYHRQVRPAETQGYPQIRVADPVDFTHEVEIPRDAK